MEIQSLKITMTEADLNALLKKLKPGDAPIENLEVQLAPEGLTIKGVYPMFMKVSFEAQWEVGIKEGNIAAKLNSLRAMGMPGNLFKSALMGIIDNAAKDKPGIRIDGDTILVDLDAVLKGEGIEAQTRLSAIDCQAGQITIIAGT